MMNILITGGCGFIGTNLSIFLNNKGYKIYTIDNFQRSGSKFNYKILKKLKNLYHLEIQPKTGRHHQIRVQLASIGCVIKGDLKYGAKRSNKNKSIHLLSRRIEFIHPVSKEKISITAPIPRDTIWEACI